MTQTTTPFDTVVADELRRQVARALATLTRRERQILIGRFMHDLTDAKLAKELGISRTRVAELRCHALNRLRHPTRMKLLEMFVE